MSIYKEVDSYLHITPEKLTGCMPRCPDPRGWARAFDDAIERFGIEDVAMLMAQVGHESADLTRLEENLNYSMIRLREVWPSRFPTAASTKGYVHNQGGLANNVYANRMGNGPPSSGDGWLRRGRGPIQLTGTYNQRKFATDIGDIKPFTHPDLLTQPKYGALSACWFYSENVPVGASVLLATQRINGGRHGLADRERRYERCREILTKKTR